MEKMKMHSPDLTEKNIERIAELFPNCVTEATGEDGKVTRTIDFDLLRQELSDAIVEGPRERYHLDWPGKRDALLAANAPIAKTLRPCREESVDFDTTQNLFIEGDNLDALKLLQETYLGKVKMIYIDPPYNTGKDFVYADNFAESTDEYRLETGQKDNEGNRLVLNPESNGRFHSDWLSMMYSRLKLARNILADVGAVFISIDDNEVPNLRKLCDEVFGADNFLSNIIIQSNKRGQTYKEIAKCHEYLLVYYKSGEASLGELEKRTTPLPFHDDQGPYDLWELRNRNPKFGKHNRPNLYYAIWVDPDSDNGEGLFRISLEKNATFSVEVLPKNSQGADSCWRWGKEKVLKDIAQATHRTLFGKMKRDGGWNIYEKSRKSTTKAKSIWADTAVITEQGTIESSQINMGGVLEFPKPLELIKRCAQLGTHDDDVILDFFAGSATTAHAVMQLNAEDGGNRKFIMVQLPEACNDKSEALKAGYKTIAEIAKERIRRAGKKILEERKQGTTKNKEGTKKENAEDGQATLFDKQEDDTVGDSRDVPGSRHLDIGFRVLKVDSSNMKDIYYTPDATSQDVLFDSVDNIKEGRTPEDLLFQVLLDWGVDLSLPIREETLQGKTVFSVDENALIACFDPEIDEDLVKELAAKKPLRVVFRDAGYGSDDVKINVEQIFTLLSPSTEVRTI